MNMHSREMEANFARRNKTGNQFHGITRLYIETIVKGGQSYGPPVDLEMLSNSMIWSEKTETRGMTTG
jgi:hypothetical protein